MFSENTCMHSKRLLLVYKQNFVLIVCIIPDNLTNLPNKKKSISVLHPQILDGKSENSIDDDTISRVHQFSVYNEAP